ncbi:MAG: MazG nucleotide pyrophosphohydrolase domain-containing protein [Patescibacteria group bacterium]
MASLKELQAKVAQTTVELGHSDDPKVVLLFLLEELGEVARAFLKEEGFKKQNNRVLETAAQEMGDLFFMLLRLAHVKGVDLEKQLDNTLTKLRRSHYQKEL